MVKLLERVEHDALTGIYIAEDIRGDFHLVDWSSSVNISEMPRTYLQTDLKGYTWPTSSGYNRIPDSFHPGDFLVYTVPQGFRYSLSFLIASACQRSGTDTITFVSIYVNGIHKVLVPLFREIAYKPYSPLVFSEGTILEFMCKPGTKSTDFGIISGGHLTKKE